ncbi:hypothetical protein P7K49_001361, partial [Saguinus oedipus]
PQNVIILHHDQGQEKENKSQVMKEENRSRSRSKEVIKHESKDKSSKKHKSKEHNDKEHSSDKEREQLNLSENGEDKHKCKESHQKAEVTQDLGLVKDSIVGEAGSGRGLSPGVGSGRSLDLEAERGRNQDSETGKENGRSGLIPAPDRDTGIGLEAGVEQGVGVKTQRRELKSQEDLAEV